MQGDAPMDQGQSSREAKMALGRVAQVLRDPSRREAFVRDPVGTVEGFENLPQGVREALRGLSEDELDVLGRMHQTFADNGFYADDEYGGPVGIF